MNRPYDHLYIYYIDGIPKIDRTIESCSDFLGLWEDDAVAFLFFSCPGEHIVEQILASSPDVRLIDRYDMSADQWHGNAIEPYAVNDLWIYPPWHPPTATDFPGGIPDRCICLDPGVVFGTGRHQTTEDCLYLIHRLCTRHDIASVLDIGTGTGLLSLGAAALGCHRVMACDFNHLAVKTTLNNVRRNGFDRQVLAFQARGEEVISIPCDLLVANIHYAVMRQMIESPALLEKKWFILSGLLNSEAGKVMDRLSQKPVHIVETRCPDGVWNTILGRPLT